MGSRYREYLRVIWGLGRDCIGILWRLCRDRIGLHRGSGFAVGICLLGRLGSLGAQGCMQRERGRHVYIYIDIYIMCVCNVKARYFLLWRYSFPELLGPPLRNLPYCFAQVPKCGFKASNSLHCLVVALKNDTSDTKECLVIYVIYATYIHAFKMSSLKNWLGSSELDG